MYRSALYYGWKPDLPDKRDLQYSVAEAGLKKLPEKIDLRSLCPPVYEQGQLGSCTANAIAAAFQFGLMKQKAPNFIPSRLFIYYNERSIENSIRSDSGAQIRDGMKSIGNLGVCPETMWPYRISEFAIKPFHLCYADALKHKAISFHRIARNIDQMKSCLAEGYPFIIGFTVYESFEGPAVARTGVLNMPAQSENVVGGHAVLVVGYEETQKRFILRNSWGARWGMEGYFTMPYEYLMIPDLSDDFWTIRLTTNNPAIREQLIQKSFGSKQPDEENIQTLPCSYPGCTYRVRYDQQAGPLPGLVNIQHAVSGDLKGDTRIYLTCDNPVTPHTLPYAVKL